LSAPLVNVIVPEIEVSRRLVSADARIAAAVIRR
jgi:hypothetical protein